MRRLLLMIVAFAGIIGSARAQVTTASMGGRVTLLSGGEAVAGAVVNAVHLPSGTTYSAVTNPDGRFSIQGMRVGRPYTVEISYLGAETATINNIGLTLGETTDVSTELIPSERMLGEIVVVGKSGMDANKTGAAMSMDSEQIGRMPSIQGRVSDVLRLNPQLNVSASGAMSFAGTNNRYNSFQIDGAMNNDVFGLSASGFNGGQASSQPVSMESIEQMQVSVAPYDVRQSGFTGGAINAITKSGTNTFHGSAYGFGNNQALIGAKYKMMNGKTSTKYEKQQEYRAGVTIGGPIVKNKLFFFANFETSNRTNPNAYNLGSDASKVNPEQANKILNKMKELARAQGLSDDIAYSTRENYVSSNKVGVKLDWNISDRHKATVRWSLVAAKNLSGTNGATSLTEKGYNFDFASNTNSFIAELQSRLTDRMSNEFRVSYVSVRDQCSPKGAPSPYIEIGSVGGGKVYFGTERSSGANALDQDIVSFTDNLSFYLGRHTLTAGTHNEFYKFSNLFIQDTYGSYYFKNMEAFEKGDIAQYRYQQANVDVTGDPRWKAKFGTGQLGFYVQDKWNATRGFDVTFGLRVDIPLFFDKPTENAPFNAYSESKGWGFRTDHKMKSTPLFSPRVGFRWKADKEGRYVLRGGAGVFTGRIPFVWLSNNFSNTGLQFSTYNESKNLSGLKLILDPNGQKPNVDQLKAGGSQVINVFSNRFKFAQNLRINLGFDFNVAGVDWTAEAIWSKTLNDVLYQNLAYGMNGKTLGDKVPGVDFDTRPMFERVTTDNDGKPFTGIYALSNTSRGYSYSLSLSGRREFAFGLDVSASYTFTRSKSLNSGTSSVANSNWQYNYIRGDSNNPELGFSAFNVPHRVTASAFWHKNYGRGRWSTTVGLIYTGSSGSPYSIYYYGDLNGDSASGNDLMFIPTDEQIDKMPFKADTKNLEYTVDTQKANMKAWIAGDPYLSKHRGEYYERYADNEPFEHQFDFHFAQKIHFGVRHGFKHSLELTFDMINVGNLFSKNWGRHATGGGAATYYSPINYDSKTSQFQFLHEADYKMRSYNDYYSRWRGQIGLRYTF